MPEVKGWKLNPDDYQYNMSIIGKITNNEITVSENHFVGAFVNGVCRGIAEPINIKGEMIYFITVYSNTPEETINFELANVSTNKFENIDELFTFIPNDLIGNIDIPQALTINGTPTSVHNISDNEMSIYPNPTRSIVYVQINFIENTTDNIALEVTDISGKIVTQLLIVSNKTAIDMSSYCSGVYFIKIKTGNDVFIEKVIVK